MEPTGERFIPGHGGAQIAYEHLLRYLFASEAVSGKRVLDVGCGEGYGAFLLAETAARVVGVDISADAIHHATTKYPLRNLSFIQGSALAVPVAGPFDVITCFEVLEHVADPEALVVECRRLLETGGLFLVSTPNKKTYTDDTGVTNPFHVKEFYFHEFRELLERHFAHAIFYGQRITFGAALWNLTPSAARPRSDQPRVREHAVRLDADAALPFSVTEPWHDDPWYFIAVCSSRPIPKPLIFRAVHLNDHSRLMQSDFVAATERWQADLDRIQQDRDRLQGALAHVQEQRDQAAALLQSVEADRATLAARLHPLEAELERLGQHLAALEADRTRLQTDVQAHGAERARLQADIETLEAERSQLLAVIQSQAAERDRLTAELHAHEAERVRLQDEIGALEAARSQAGVRTHALEADRVALQAQVASLESALSRLQARAGAQRDMMRRQIEDARRQAERAADDLRSTQAHWQEQTRVLYDRLATASTALQSIEHSVAWRVILRYRTVLDRLAPMGTTRRQSYTRALAAVVNAYGALATWWRGQRPTHAQIPQGQIPASGPTSPVAQPLADTTPRRAQASAVDIVVPVYNGLAALRDCVTSLLEHTDLSTHHLILIDDASPDQGVGAYLADLQAQLSGNRQVVVVRHADNRGFVRAANEGFRYSDRDVVLLNSDTVVTSGWLEKLQRAAYSDRNIATATPFSNNATICSIPEFAKDNVIPDGFSLETFAALVDRCSLRYYPRIPTAVGFCMYVRRQALDDVGVFDEERFGKGYGEENDFCMRAARKGWVHVLDDATYVYHQGAASFGDEVKRTQIERHLNVLDALYPDYRPMVHQFIANNPLRPLHDHIRASMRSNGGRGP